MDARPRASISTQSDSVSDTVPSPTAAAVATPLRGHTRRVGWTRIGHGLYVPGEPSDLLSTLRAWRLVLPADSHFTGLTTAAVRGWWQLDIPPSAPIFVGMGTDAPRPRRAEIVVCRHSRPVPTVESHGLRLAAPAEALLAAARDLALIDLVVLIDSALAAGDVTVSEVQASCRLRRRGTRRLAEALTLADGRSESPWESVLRLFFAMCEVPVDVQVPILGPNGVTVARADLMIRGTRRLVEYDGDSHRSIHGQARDMARDRLLMSLRLQRYPYNAVNIRMSPQRLLREADEALGRTHEPSRLRPWLAAHRESTLSADGRARLRARWRT